MHDVPNTDINIVSVMLQTNAQIEHNMTACLHLSLIILLVCVMYVAQLY